MYDVRYSDDDCAVMRKACKLMVVGIDRVEREVVKEPFFQHIVGAAVEKVSFRYLLGLIHRCTDEQSGGKMITSEASDSSFILYFFISLISTFSCNGSTV